MITEDKTIEDPESLGGRMFRTQEGTLVRISLVNRDAPEGNVAFSAHCTIVDEGGSSMMTAPEHIITIPLVESATFDADAVLLASAEGAVLSAEEAFKRKAALDAVEASWR